MSWTGKVSCKPTIQTQKLPSRGAWRCGCHFVRRLLRCASVDWRFNHPRVRRGKVNLNSNCKGLGTTCKQVHEEVQHWPLAFGRPLIRVNRILLLMYPSIFVPFEIGSTWRGETSGGAEDKGWDIGDEYAMLHLASDIALSLLSDARPLSTYVSWEVNALGRKIAYKALAYKACTLCVIESWTPMQDYYLPCSWWKIVEQLGRYDISSQRTRFTQVSQSIRLRISVNCTSMTFPVEPDRFTKCRV
jgi:hypothetical protein